MLRPSILRLLAVLFVVTISTTSGMAQIANSGELIRYSGSDGIEFSYPANWARVPRLKEQQIPPSLLLVRSSGGEQALTAFSYFKIDLSAEPIENLNAKRVAEVTVEVARKADPSSIKRDCTEANFGGLSSCYFEIQRKSPDGQVITRNWAVVWRDGGYLFTFSVPPGGVTADVEQEISRIVGSFNFAAHYRKDDGTNVKFSDPIMRIAFDVPSHWHDETASVGARARWSAFDEEGKKIGSAQLAYSRVDDSPFDLEAYTEKTTSELMKLLTDTDSTVRRHKTTVDSSPVIERVFAGRRGQSSIWKFRVVVIRRDDRLFLLMSGGDVTGYLKFDEQWESLLESVRLTPED